MKLIVLPGNSSKNKRWAKDIATMFTPLFDNVKMFDYNHWKNGEEIINFETELTKLVAATDALPEFWIFGKSAGTLLALKGISEKKVAPVGCIFTGLPINWARHYKFPVDEYLQNYDIPTLFIQQTSDPSYSFTELAMLLKEKQVKNHKLIEISGNDHQYQDLEQIRLESERFLKEQTR